VISIIDTSALITFYQLGIVRHFNNLFNEVYVPITVEGQFLKKDTDNKLAFLLPFYDENTWFKKCQTYESGVMNILATNRKIDEGEREAIAQYKQLQQDLEREEGTIVCVLDEKDGRKVARNMDIRVNGTLYLLARLSFMDLIDYHNTVDTVKVSRRFSEKAILDAYAKAKSDL
jgi:predicted nucleic acid-binding protein